MEHPTPAVQHPRGGRTAALGLLAHVLERLEQQGRTQVRSGLYPPCHQAKHVTRGDLPFLRPALPHRFVAVVRIQKSQRLRYRQSASAFTLAIVSRQKQRHLRQSGWAGDRSCKVLLNDVDRRRRRGFESPAAPRDRGFLEQSAGSGWFTKRQAPGPPAPTARH